MTGVAAHGSAVLTMVSPSDPDANDLALKYWGEHIIGG
jgi:hypothetical protein